eukprot:3002585-Pleurochrysis_carterae.AAC.2
MPDGERGCVRGGCGARGALADRGGIVQQGLRLCTSRGASTYCEGKFSERALREKAARGKRERWRQRRRRGERERETNPERE